MHQQEWTSKANLEINMDLEGYNSKKFSNEIETLSLRLGINYIDAIIHFCEENGITIDEIIHLVNKPLKLKIEDNARTLNFLPRIPTLPI